MARGASPSPSLWPDAAPTTAPYERDAFEAAALRNRMPFRNLPAPGTSPVERFAETLAAAGPRALGGLGRVMQDYSASQFPGTYGVTEQTTDYDPRREAAGWAAGTAMNMVGVPGFTGGAPAGAVVASGMRRPPGIGHNNPPPEYRLPSKASIKKAVDVPDIRGMPTDEAIESARKQYHLIKAGEKAEGLYVGGPRDVQSKATLNKIRRDFDEYLAADPRGADWYDRYRRNMTEVTGGDPLQNKWMSAQEGQWSAGVDPGSEIQFALKENNASIAGMPVKANYPAQHEAHLRALAANDPSLYQLGEKTGEYAVKVNPDQLLPPGATGVNDFRHARNFRYTEPSGEPQKGALGDAGHRFLDYETALAVDRANQSALGGRTDWTGEKLQAAPWVRQKALDLMSRNPALTYEEAFTRANRTIGDYFDRHTYLATHEAQPGADVVGHMTGSRDAGPLARKEFFEDPRSTWATAPGGRDAIYAGTGIEGTGNYMRVRPTVEMQGMYRRPDGTLETNPGAVARPLGTFDTGGKGEAFKSASPADRALLNAGEALRAYVDAQNAGAWHKLWFGGPAKESNSLFFPREGKASLNDLFAIEAAGAKHGLPDVVDTGRGITSTRFWPPPEGGKAFDQALRKGEFTPYGEPRRAKVDSDIIEYVEKWKEGVGSQAATKKMLEYINKTPEIRAAFNNNPNIPQQALNRLERDESWAKVWGQPREDIQNARRIIGEGPGWVDRLDAAIKNRRPRRRFLRRQRLLAPAKDRKRPRVCPPIEVKFLFFSVGRLMIVAAVFGHLPDHSTPLQITLGM
jgi:hypothetical protein